MDFDRDKLMLILISTLPLILASLIAAAIMESSLIGQIIAESPNLTPTQFVVQASVSVVMSLAVVLSLFWVINKQGRAGKKFVVTFIVSPILFFVSIFIGQTFLMILFKGATNPLQGLVLVLSMAVSMLSIVLIVVDAFPPMLRNIFVAFYGSMFGIFMGVTIITSSMLVLVLSLVVEDYFLSKHSPAAKAATLEGRVGKDPFDYTRIQSKRVTVGVGDYVAFSLIVSHAFLFFPIYVWLMSILLAFVGVIINVTVLVEEEKILPAIPLPALLAVFPWMVHIGTLLFLGL